MLAPAAAALAVRATLTIGWHALSDVRRRRHATATSAS
jgi:hypothetical protein